MVFLQTCCRLVKLLNISRNVTNNCTISRVITGSKTSFAGFHTVNKSRTIATVCSRQYERLHTCSCLYDKRKTKSKPNNIKESVPHQGATNEDIPIIVKMMTDQKNQHEIQCDPQLNLDELLLEYESIIEAQKMAPDVLIQKESKVWDPKDADSKDAIIYGTPDPSIPLSELPCQGCGATLHCQDPTVPGYLPSQKFITLPLRRLKEAHCQRCTLIKYHNLALGVRLSAKDYAQVISKIRDVKGLIVLVVDLMDLPNSIFPGVAELVGPEKPIYLVGNKADLLPMDNTGYLQRCKDTLVRLCKAAGIGRHGNIQHVALVSGKTMYGVEELVTHLMKHWARQGDVYIIGCTNVGKSTLYNALLSSDYCKATARDVLSRATTCVWPGTTLNLLRFPIVDPAHWRLALRAQRLLQQKNSQLEEKKHRLDQLKSTNKLKHATLMGHLGLTEKDRRHIVMAVDYGTDAEGSYRFTDEGLKEDSVGTQQAEDFDPTKYTRSRWCFDTPGAVNMNQIINLLTQEELRPALMLSMPRPRSFILMPGDSMWISGLARIDYLKGATTVYFTVIASNKIPIHVMKTEKADQFYKDNIGTKAFGIPLGDAERLSKLPPLEGQVYNLTGVGWKESIADLVLSSLGWVSVTAGQGMEISMKAYTPNKYGLYYRSPPLLPCAVNLRGKRIRNTKAYSVKKPKSPDS